MLDATEAEQAVLGCIFLEPTAYFTAAQDLSPEDFHDPICRSVFVEMGKTVEKGGQIDTTSLEGFAPAALCLFLETVPTAANLTYYIGLVLENSQRRSLEGACRHIQELLAGDHETEVVLTEAETAILGVRKLKTATSCRPFSAISLETYQELEKREVAGPVRGRRSGLRRLDDLLGGFAKTELCILAARPSCGKSAFLGHILALAAEEKQKVLLFSLEMSQRQVSNRFYAAASSVPLSVMVQGIPTPEEWQKLAQAAGKFSEYAFHVDDSGSLTVPRLASIARRIKAEGGLDLVGIDYLQLLSPGGRKRENREGEIAEMTRQLKALAKELDVPIILLAQLNRQCEQREDKRPKLSDLRESGAIEQDANKVIMLYRDSLYNKNADEEEIEILVRKNRDGPTGFAKARFMADRMRFSDGDERERANGTLMSIRPKRPVLS